MIIAHATALGATDAGAFEHALALAMATGAHLLSVNAHDSAAPSERIVPRADDYLARWGRPLAGVTHEVIEHACCDDPVDTLLDALHRVAPDVVVTGTTHPDTMTRLFLGSRCEALLRNVIQPTLVLPQGAESIVGDDGRLEVKRIVVPVGDEVCARAAMRWAVWLAETVKADDVTFVQVFAGDAGDAPTVADLPAHRGWRIEHRASHQSITDAVVEAVGEGAIVVMATRGPDSLRDTIFGTHTEQVLRRAASPVLIVRSTNP